MKKIAAILLLFLLASGFTAMAPHKFYVGVFQLDYAPGKNEVQLTSRLFIDDMEAALDKKYGKKFYFGSPRELPEANDFLKKYIIERMQISLNGKSRSIKFLGKETEDDILICYYTITAAETVNTIEIKNTVLFDAFAGQQNIIHANINRNRKSLLLTNSEPQGTLQF